MPGILTVLSSILVVLTSILMVQSQPKRRAVGHAKGALHEIVLPHLHSAADFLPFEAFSSSK